MAVLQEAVNRRLNVIFSANMVPIINFSSVIIIVLKISVWDLK